ncbi:Hint domain-containing protein [Halobacteriovorax sp. JY17]|uniref:Hint domain-containing protein n=1 Tax=Halobacteriovorax sp. JY17 TaxID=2014617 RepID=UPI000C671CA4|nr:Hint domain-containing protein [Halobacteriovorax sp. JY17]PIK15716.1 MAG: hypothetical protein CES88_03025 [Halobacteriovorax sp. JY17]
MNAKKWITSALILMSANSMAAGGFAEARCAAWGDNLTQPQAAERWKWAMKCDVANSRILWTYREYTAPDGSKRPAYPIYGLLDQDYKKEPSNPLGWFPPKSASADCNIPENYEIVGFCAGGCYTADQLILVDGRELFIKDMLESEIKNVMTLDQDSTLDSIATKPGKVFSYMKSIVSGVHPIIKLTTDSGKNLSVTLEHPLVKADGTFIVAQDLEVGSKLLNEFGEIEVVTSIAQEEVEGKVYNLRTEGAEETDRVIVAQGLLNGDLTVQQRKANKANQVLLRKKMIRGELIK